jgi:magnesium transporter
MLAFFEKLSQKAGLPPGTPVYVGERKAEEVKITVIDYDEENFEAREVQAEECEAFREKATITWINVSGLHEVEPIEGLGRKFGIHPLVIEDIVNTEQRPKTEVFDDYIFAVVKMNMFNDGLDSEQVSMILGERYVITFQEKERDIFDPVRKRIKDGKGSIRKAGSDYLAYALMDALVDSNFHVVERFSERIEDMEDELVTNPSPETLQTIHSLKTQMITLRKAVWPMREVISGLERSGSRLIKDSTRIYLRDVYDHTIQLIDTVETQRDLLSGMLDIYLSSVSNRLNEVMKVLTIFASIFIPLTFIAGVYGMNFQYMPELRWHWGYFAVLGVMLAVGVLLLSFFKRKRWL